MAQWVKNQPVLQETQEMQIWRWEDTLEEEMETHSSVLTWKIPWTKETGVLQSIELQRVGNDRAARHAHIDIDEY